MTRTEQRQKTCEVRQCFRVIVDALPGEQVRRRFHCGLSAGLNHGMCRFVGAVITVMEFSACGCASSWIRF